MDFSSEEKNQILKAFTDLIIDANGKGPQSIHIIYLIDEIHISIHGVVSAFEKYLIRNFGQEAIDILTNFYERDCYNVEKIFLTRIEKINKLKLKFYELETDFLDDHFVYKMKIETQET